ncbi:MAG: ABC transporter ATP-binding protein [Bacteroidetes bacterium]|nr:MAG: ABC transporter ATP-binding protein [Bacteroidota bacterium]
MIKIENLNFGYKKNQKLFRELNLELQPGNIYGLFGMNGAGKTTLLKLMSGMLFPKSGDCHIFNRNVASRLPEVLANIYVIPEEFVLPPVTIKTFVELNAPFYPRFDITLLDKYLREFEISNDKKLTAYSYGQKKKFLIAFGLATQTNVLLMDEPTNGLDIPSKSQFRRIMAAASTEDQCIIISTHQVRDLASIIDHVIILENGKIIFKESLMDISTKLTFGKVKEDTTSGILYAEEVLGGKAAIRKNTGQDTAVDLELLFNGVIKNSEIINNAIKS